MGSAFGAGAGADALQEILRQKFGEVMARQRGDQEQQRIGLEQQRNLEMQKSRELQQQQQAENSRVLNDERTASAERIRAAAAAKTDHDAQVQGFFNTPGLSPAVQQWARGAALGFNQLTPHDYEAPDVHRAHVDADAKQKADEAFAQHRRTRDYDNAHQAPVRIAGAKVVTDDPSLPLGAQRYIAQIATKHADDPNAARAELSAYLNDPQTQSVHPQLSPVKALEALKRSAPAGQTDPLDALIAQASAGLLGNAQGGGRGGAPGATPRVSGATGPTVAADPLGAKAREALEAAGYAATPENIQKFLSNPANRQKLGGQ